MKLSANNIALKYGMLSIEEVSLIKLCCSHLPADFIAVNIGLNVGTSCIAMLEASLKSYVYNLDRKPCLEAFENMRLCELDINRTHLTIGDTNKVNRWATPIPEQVDLVFVDGGHDDTTLRNDIDKFVSLVKPGGFALYHDYNHPNYAKKPTVNLDKIVNEAMKDWQRFGQARYLVAFRK